MADLVLSVVGILSNNLSILMSEEGKLNGGLRQEIQLISDEFGHMKSFLEAVEFNEEDDPRLKEWIRQVREAAYDTEDVLDEFSHLFGRNYRPGFFGYAHLNLNSIKNSLVRRRLATRLQSIKVRIRNISEARLRYESQYRKILHKFPSFCHSKDDEALHAKESELVGIDQPKERLISQLLEGSSQLKVIAVVGMGGIGKTTLVKKVHTHAAVESHFCILVWVTVSQAYDFKDFLKGLIRRLHAGCNELAPPGMELMDIDELKALIKAFLQRGRYAIVFDDVWDRDFWDAFKFVLPENPYGGNCVMLTTRIADVATASCTEPNGYVYKMQHLTFKDSWTLFCRRTFKDSSCPPHLGKVVEGIVEKCQGLPLAILAISGALASKDLNRIDEWERVGLRLGDECEDGGKLDRAKKILLMSYNDLPPTLKTCMLYTCIYPQDYEINCFHLIQLWIAERFVEERTGPNPEKVVWDYLQELSRRSLIQLPEGTYHGLPEFIRIHDLMREVILSEAKEKNLITIVGAGQHTRICCPHRKVVRRLVLHSNDVLHTWVMQESRRHSFINLRSIIALGCTEPLPKSLSYELLSSKFLKVLDLEGMELENFPKEIFNLYHLTYLNLRCTRIKTVPKSIRRLQNLEHLDLSGTNVRELPVEILKLQKLRKIWVFQEVDWSDRDLGCYGFRAPCNMGALSSLQSLIRIDAAGNNKTRIIKEIRKLSQLRELAITNLRIEDGKELCSSLAKLTNLRGLEIASLVEKDEVNTLDLNHNIPSSVLQTLCYLELSGRLEKMPPWIRKLHNLGQINLRWSGLWDDPLESLQRLPNLMEVCLSGAYNGESLCFKAGSFLKLKKLIVRKMKGLRWIRAEEGAMPNVNKMFLQLLPLLEELAVQHLRELQVLEVWGISCQLTNKLLKNEDEGGEDYNRIAHIPSVQIWFQRDGKWQSYKKKTRGNQTQVAVFPDDGSGTQA